MMKYQVILKFYKIWWILFNENLQFSDWINKFNFQKKLLSRVSITRITLEVSGSILPP